MLDTDRQQVFGHQLKWLPITVEGLDGDPPGALHRLEHPGHRQATFLDAKNPLARGDHGVYEHPQLAAVGGGIDHHHPLLYIDLDGRQTDTGRLIHGLGHVIDQPPDTAIDALDPGCRPAQTRVGVMKDGTHGHGGIIPELALVYPPEVDSTLIPYYTPSMRLIRLSLLLFVALTGAAVADRLAVPSVPHRYVVVRGNTLWGIAQHFFADPWRWPGIWNRNRQIRNPDLIYPGDVIVLRYDHGRPELIDLGPAPVPAVGNRHRLRTVILRPRIRITALPHPVPTISPATIAPFLRHPLALSRHQLRRLGYVVATVHHRTFIGPFGRFYARHLGAHPAPVYDIYQRGPSLRNRHGRLLAYETNYIGQARLLHAGHPAELEVISAVREVRVTDRLIPRQASSPIPYYYPRAPRHPLHGQIVGASHNHVNLGTYAVLAMDIGRTAGARRGYVLRIYTPPQRERDPMTGHEFTIPPRPIGLIMVFRTFAHVSYGIVMQSRQEILVGDGVAGP